MPHVCGNYVKKREGYNPNSAYIADWRINYEHHALEIHVSGFKHPCMGYENRYHCFDKGKDYPCILDRLLKDALIAKNSGIVDSIWICGGEPEDQHINVFADFLCELRLLGLTMVMWTHYLPDNLGPEYEDWFKFKPFFDYVKVGPYKAGGIPHIDPLLGIELPNKEQYVIEVPDHQKYQEVKHPPILGDMDPLMFIWYEQLHEDDKIADADLPPSFQFYHKLYCQRQGLYFGRQGILYTISPNHHTNDPEIGVAYNFNWFISNEVPVKLRARLLNGDPIPISDLTYD